MNSHLMVDIETLGHIADSAIIAVGAVRFKKYPDDYKILNTYYTGISLESNLKIGRTIDAETLAWWVDNNPSLLYSMITSKCSIKDALVGLAYFVERGSDSSVWANGTDFDVALLRHAYKQQDIQHPWVYNKTRDCRTIFKLYGHLVSRTDSGVKHNALDDCYNQAVYLDAVLRTLGGKIDGKFSDTVAISCNNCEYFDRKCHPASGEYSCADYVKKEHKSCGVCACRGTSCVPPVGRIYCSGFVSQNDVWRCSDCEDADSDAVAFDRFAKANKKGE